MYHAARTLDLCPLAFGLQVAQDLEKTRPNSEESFLDFGSRTVEVERHPGHSNRIDGLMAVRKMMTVVVGRKTVEKTVDHVDFHYYHCLSKALEER